MIKFTYIVSLIILVLIGACREERKYKEFFNLSLEKRHEEFRKFPIEKQFDIYILAMRRHPPDISFADDIASRGEETIPFLIDKLSKTNNEGVQHDIIFIFEKMVLFYNYDLRSNNELVTLLKATVSFMKYPAYKEGSEESLKIILQGPKTSK